MAKQSGIHQLRGKVGEHSYYRQTGVQSGIVRAINQGMSSKVKTDEAFANTRLNNAEFGQAGRIASVLARFIVPKFRPMVLPFSQSRMAKYLLESIKQGAGVWGQRNISDPNGEILSTSLNIVAKNNFADYGIEVSVSSDNAEVTLSTTSTFIDKLRAIGAEAAQVKVVAAAPWVGVYSQGENRYADSFARGIDRLFVLEPGISDTDVELTWRPAPPQGWPATMSRFVVVIILPYRSIGGNEYILQEHCTFAAFPTIASATTES